MSETLTHSVQDYLKNIYELNALGMPASTMNLAQRLDVAPASVTGMIQRMASTTPPLILYKKHQGATLTPDGERAALEVIRHHRLIETYLVRELGYTWDEVHEEACRLEHVISENFEARIAKVLGDPSHDPHGDPIPRADLTMPDDDLSLLSDLRPGDQATVERVNNEDSAFLRHVEQIGLVPHTQLSIEGYSEIDGNLTIKLSDHTIVVGTAISKHILVSNRS